MSLCTVFVWLMVIEKNLIVMNVEANVLVINWKSFFLSRFVAALENSLTVVQNDETMNLTPLPPPQQRPVLDKSR